MGDRRAVGRLASILQIWIFSRLLLFLSVCVSFLCVWVSGCRYVCVIHDIC